MDRSFLAQCEQEQLHRSGAIQGHGSLLAVAADGRVSHAAANVAGFLGRPPQDWIGRALPAPLASLLLDMPETAGSRRFLKSSVEGVCGVLDLSINRGEGGELLLEFTPAEPAAPCKTCLVPALGSVFGDEEALIQARQRLLEDIGALTSPQRVLYYAFYEQGDGEVISEVRRGETFGSYLGLRFPASDIPRIARALYLKNPWRLIPDARREPVALLGDRPQPPDLTWSDLRSVSPVHCTYLANMGVVGSLSFPVVVAGQLVALIAVHHHQALHLPHSLLEDLAERVRAFAHGLAAFRAQCRMRLVDNLVRRFQSVRELLRRHGDLLSAWPEAAAILLREFRADGAVLVLDQHWSEVGQRLEPQAFESLDDWFCHQQDELAWTCDSLSRHIPGFPLSETAGVLALRLPGPAGAPLRVYLTRCEHIHEVAWGGNPDKPVEFHDGVLGITPRRSFEKWVEKRLGYSRPWENEARLLGLKLRELLQSELRG